MTLGCTCDRLRKAEKKAAKWDAIVKCRNCKHSYQDIPSAYFQCVRLFAKVSPDSFCSCGERGGRDGRP